MTRLALVALLLAAPLAALDDCPQPDAGDVGFSITLNPAVVASSQSGAQHVFTTHGADADMQLLVDALDAVAAGTPERRIQFKTTAGATLNVCRSQIITGGSSRFTGGFVLDADATEGLRICAYVDADESNGADQHAPATACAAGTGGFGIWTMAYLAPATSNLANPGTYDLTTTLGQDTPAAVAAGPFGSAFDFYRTGNMAYWEMAASNAVSMSKTFTAMVGFAPTDTANATGRQILVERRGTDGWRTPFTLWWRDNVWPKSLTAPLQGNGFGPVEFKSDNVGETQFTWCTSSVAANNRSCYELGGSGPVATGTQPDATETTATSYFSWGGQANTKTAALNGSAWHLFYKEDFVIAEDAARMLEAELHDPDAAWTVAAIPPAVTVKYRVGGGTSFVFAPAAGEWAAVAAATCVDGEVQLGDACAPDPGGSDGEAGALSIILGGIWQ